MRMILAAIGLCVVLGSAGRLFAQTPSQSLYEKDDGLPPGRRASFAEQRIQERAGQSAQERLARIESRHWQGVSLQRPLVSTSPSASLGAEFLLVSPWRFRGAYGGFYKYHSR